MKKVLFDISGHETWIGGVYYMRNIIFQICVNQNLTKICIPIIVYSTKFEELFDCFEKNAVLYKYDEKYRSHRGMLLLKATLEADYIYYYHDFKFDPFHILKRKAINWIPDFQECYYPEFFTAEQLEFRKLRAEKYIKSDRPLVFSSKSCMEDFFRFYCNDSSKNEIYIIPFVSAIEDELKQISEERIIKILAEHSLPKKFALVSNQFWQHKNHIIILEAMKIYFRKNKDLDFKIAFTGKLDDYRNQDYIKQIRSLFNDKEIKKHAVMLGFINRIDQLALMKKAQFIIQPSLFEGWGTVVEDAKVLNKTILLSDIPVHREQMNDKCVLFDPYDPFALANLIEQENRKYHNDITEIGIQDMHRRAADYAKNFEQMLINLERN